MTAIIVNTNNRLCHLLCPLCIWFNTVGDTDESIVQGPRSRFMDLGGIESKILTQHNVVALDVGATKTDSTYRY